MNKVRLLVLFLLLFGLSGVVRAQADVNARGEDEAEFKRIIKTDGSGRLQGVQGQKQIDSCDVVTGWTVLGNDTINLAVDLDHVEGSNSLEFDKTDGAANTIFGGIQKTLTAIDIETYMANNGYILASYNLSALTDVAYCFIRLGTDSSNYNEWRVDDDSMTTGWQQVRFPFYSPSSAGNTGNGIDAAIVTYVAIGCAFDLETSALAAIRVDNIAVNTNLQTSTDLSSQIGTGSATSDVNVAEVKGTPPSLTNPLHVELSDGAAAFLDSTAAPGYTRDQDGDSTVVGDILEAYVDALPLTLNGKMTVAVLAGSNGSTIDLGKVSSTDGIIVYLENHRNSYDPANGWDNINIKGITSITEPAVEVTTIVSTSTDILTSTVVSNYSAVTLYIYNDDASDSLISTAVQVSATGAAGDWITLTGSDCGAMGPLTGCRYSFDNPEKYMKVIALDAGTVTDMRVILFAHIR